MFANNSSLRSLQKIRQYFVSMFGEYRLGVELHAMYCQGPVAHAHDLAVVGPSRYFKTVRQRLALDHQRVVARCGERIRQAGEYAGVVVMDRRCLAVHQLFGVVDAPAERLADVLMTE